MLSLTIGNFLFAKNAAQVEHLDWGNIVLHQAGNLIDIDGGHGTFVAVLGDKSAVTWGGPDGTRDRVRGVGPLCAPGASAFVDNVFQQCTPWNTQANDPNDEWQNTIFNHNGGVGALPVADVP